MHFSSSLIYALAAIALHAVDAFNVNVPAGDQRCFFEVLEKGDNLRVSFQVAEGGHLDVDFSVSLAATNDNDPLWEHRPLTTEEKLFHVGI